MRVFDVDDDAAVGPEVDILYVNGTEVGTLSGADNQWSINTFEFPLELLRLPTSTNPQGRNDFEVDIDTTNNGWAVEVDWAELRLIEDFVPLGLVHGFQPGERLADVSTYFVDKGYTPPPQHLVDGILRSHSILWFSGNRTSAKPQCGSRQGQGSAKDLIWSDLT